MKIRTKLTSLLVSLVLGVGLMMPAQAQSFPFPIPGRGGGSVGIGDVISIIGSQRNRGSNNNRGSINNRGSNGNHRGQDRSSQVIGIASVLFDLTQQRQRTNSPTNPPFPSGRQYPNPYPTDNQFPSGRQYPTDDSVPSGSQVVRPDGYAYIENSGRPIRLDPRVVPITINAGGGQGDQVVARAVETWNSAGIGQVFAVTSGAADLHIDWSGAKVSSGARAETRMIRSRDYVVPTDLSVRTSGRSPEQIARVVTHELGHVLGLDHSDERSDVMYRSEQNGSTSLTRRDLAMLRWLYGQADYSPVIGRTDTNGLPSVASQWSSRGLEQVSSQPVCSRH